MDKSQSRSTSEGSGSHRKYQKLSSIFFVIKLTRYIFFCIIAESIDSKPNRSTEQLPKITPPPEKPVVGGSSIAASQQSNNPTSDSVTSAPTCDNYSYVQLTSTPDFSNPSVAGSDAYAISARCDSTSSLKKRTTFDPPLGSLKERHGTLPIRTNLRCKYCSKFYNHEWNRAGSCDYAPDCFKNGIETISGMQCAKCMVYHCMGDPEGEGSDNPCSCTGESGCTKR